nr:hypothetical protein [uncultured Agathobaculum sp.]
MTNEQAIEALQLRGRLEISGDAARLAEFMEGLSVALDALRSSPANNPLTLEQLCQMDGQKVLLYRMKSTEPLEKGTVKENGDVLGDCGTLAYHELYLETWVAFSYHPDGYTVDSLTSEARTELEKQMLEGAGSMTNGDRIRAMRDEELYDAIKGTDRCPPKKAPLGCDGNCAECWIDWLGQSAEGVKKDNDLDFDTTHPQPDFVFRAEKELQKAANDLEQAVRRGAPQANIFNLQRKVEYKQYILGLLKGR